MIESLSIQQARKLVLLSQRLPPAKQTGSAGAATLSAIEHLGYIQIDTISAIQRAHHHTLWNRNPRYKTSHLSQLIADKQVFEYWSHPYRVNFHKVYDLTERVLPEDTDTTLPDPKEYARFLITRYLQANGLGKSAEIAYLLKNTKPLVSATLQEMVSNKELLQISAGGNSYYALPASLELLSKPLARSKLKILSPFDNLLIQRKRIQALFGFDYQLECYVPEAKRQYGYFSLPVLWNGKLVARMDCKAERKKSLLHIHHLALEPRLEKTGAFFLALHKELAFFLQFNNCSNLRFHRTSPASFKPVLQDAINRLTR